MAVVKKRSELTLEVKNLVLDLYQRGEKISNIARILEIPRSTVDSVVIKFRDRGNVENIKRPGRPPLICDREYRKLERIVKRERRAPLNEITARFNENRGNRVSSKTVKRKLRQHGYKRGVCRKKVVIKRVNRKKRVSWCREKRWKTVNNFWKYVIFSDESQVCVGHDHRVYVWRKDGEGWRPDLVERQEQRPIQVMIWGCVCFNGVGTLCRVEGTINAAKYINILEDNIWPVIVRHFPNNNYLFQDDNAPVHRARIVKEYTARNGLKCMSWPAQSPDINIIENVWLYIKRKLQMRVNHINSPEDLFSEILRIWQSIDVMYIRSLYKSLPKRIQSVIRLKGHLTKY